jgi:glutamate carboxypeptidase
MARVIWQNAPMISRTGLMLALLACPLSAAPARTPLTVAERALVKSVDVHNAECLALLERVVNINSGTHNLSGIREVGRIFRAEFDGLGFETRWVSQDEVGRAGHLIAEHPGTGPRIRDRRPQDAAHSDIARRRPPCADRACD